MKRKFFLILPCIAAVAIATFVGKKTFESNAYESDALLAQNVEALTAGFEIEAEGTFICEGNSGICAKGKDENTGHDFIIHGILKIMK